MIDRFRQTSLSVSKVHMSIVDDILKEKQRVGEALARIDAQREKLASELAELAATERVLARYGKDTRAKKNVFGDQSGCSSATTGSLALAHGKIRWQDAHCTDPW
jgi:hypothetical protein